MTRPSYKPIYEETEEAIRERMLGRISDDWRKDPGDFIYDAVAASPAEIKTLQQGQDTILKRAFAQYAEDEWLDLKLAEIGLERIGAKTTQRGLSIKAAKGVVLPQGHTISTITLVSEGNPLQFTLDATTTYAEAGTQTIGITCKTAGEIGNVPTGIGFILIPPIPGVEVITDLGVTVPGQDRESNDDAYARYDFKVKHPDTGGNKNDYKRWVEPLDGVGKLRVIPRWAGNGTVKVVLVGDDFLPATPEVVTAVQTYLDPMLNVIVEAEILTLTGNGATVDATQSDDSGSSVKMVYDAGGAGIATLSSLENLLETENHFKARVKVKVDSTAGADNLLQIRVLAGGVPVKQTKGGNDDAAVTKKASQLTTEFAYVEVPFYYDGDQALTLEVRRLTTDNATLVWVDQVNVVGVYGQGLGYGQAPGGARVLAKAADQLALNIVASGVVYAAGAVPATVKAAFEAAVTDYLHDEVIFVENAQVVVNRIGAILQFTPGVVKYAALTVNGGTVDITPGREEAPTLGAVTLNV